MVEGNSFEETKLKGSNFEKLLKILPITIWQQNKNISLSVDKYD